MTEEEKTKERTKKKQMTEQFPVQIQVIGSQ